MYYLFFYFPNQFPIFILGIFLYWILLDVNRIKYIIPLYMIVKLIPNSLMPFNKPFLQWSLYFIVLFIVFKYFLRSNMITRIFAYIGKISYSMYLANVAVLFWLNKLNVFDLFPIMEYSTHGIINFFLRYLVFICATMLVATVTYFIVEKTFISLGNKIILERENPVLEVQVQKCKL